MNSQTQISTKNNFLRTLHYLSLDVVLGAVASSSMFWKMPDGKQDINLPSILVLGICTWTIYIFDRLLDNLKSDPEDARHTFHFQHQYYLQIVIVMMALMVVILSFFLPVTVIYFGMMLLILMRIYFYILQKKSKHDDYQYFKEIFTATIYTLCVAGTALVTKKNLDWTVYLSAGVFFLLVLQSLLIFSFFELQVYPETKNLAKKLGKINCTYLIFGITTLTAFCCFFSANIFLQKVLFVETLMALCSTLIYVFGEKLIKNEHYRWLGEMVFWLPILLIFF